MHTIIEGAWFSIDNIQRNIQFYLKGLYTSIHKKLTPPIKKKKLDEIKH